MKLPESWRVACHTDNIGTGSTFVAIKGDNADGSDFIARAIERGAQRIVVSCDTLLSSSLDELIAQSNIEVLRVAHTRKALAQLSAQAYDYPAKKLNIIAITGTKGKTTTACLTYHMLRQSGMRVALISTVYNKINDSVFRSSLTTPQPDYLHMFFSRCVAEGVTHVVMEVAAQATTLYRVYDIQFDAVAFTNFGHEHSEFYATFDEYFDAKMQVIRQAKSTAPILINNDDTRVASIKSSYDYAQTISLHDRSSDFFVALDDSTNALQGKIVCKGISVPFICNALLGDFNAANIAAAVGLAHNVGVSVHDSVQAIETMPSLPGRLERYLLARDIECIIDYAHTPESYECLLSLLRKRTHYLTVVFGAGGARDASKRPRMGAIAAQYADRVFITSDNPRREDPHAIAQDIMSGIDACYRPKITVELDREKAIIYACQKSERGGIVALLGKGPDEYQIIGSQKIPFSEKAIVQNISL